MQTQPFVGSSIKPVQSKQTNKKLFDLCFFFFRTFALFSVLNRPLVHLKLTVTWTERWSWRRGAECGFHSGWGTKLIRFITTSGARRRRRETRHRFNPSLPNAPCLFGVESASSCFRRGASSRGQNRVPAYPLSARAGLRLAELSAARSLSLSLPRMCVWFFWEQQHLLGVTDVGH